MEGTYKPYMSMNNDFIDTLFREQIMHGQLQKVFQSHEEGIPYSSGPPIPIGEGVDSFEQVVHHSHLDQRDVPPPMKIEN